MQCPELKVSCEQPCQYAPQPPTQLNLQPTLPLPEVLHFCSVQSGGCCADLTALPMDSGGPRTEPDAEGQRSVEVPGPRQATISAIAEMVAWRIGERSPSKQEHQTESKVNAKQQPQ